MCGLEIKRNSASRNKLLTGKVGELKQVWGELEKILKLTKWRGDGFFDTQEKRDDSSNSMKATKLILIYSDVTENMLNNIM